MCYYWFMARKSDTNSNKTVKMKDDSTVDYLDPTGNGGKVLVEKHNDSVYRNGKDQRYTDEAYARFRAYQQVWSKENRVSVHLHLSSTKDKAIIDWLNERPNKTDYIRKLVEKDMKRCQKKQKKPEDE